MSKFLHSKYKSITPYDTSSEVESFDNYIRLNTNESPFEPSHLAIEYASRAALTLNYYCDPECSMLAKKLADMFGVKPSQIVFGNGSDEILNFLFMAFCEHGAVFPDITYSFYKILADFHGVNYTTKDLHDFMIDPDDYKNLNGQTIFIANPNAPTGLILPVSEIERIITQNPSSLIVIDEAYIDFAGGVNALELVKKYSSVVIVRTFSKSRSLAGGRLGFCITSEELAGEIRNIKNTLTPYNINAMTQGAGLGSLEDEDYTQKNIETICKTRELVKSELRLIGFEVLDSATNFLFAKHENFSGQKIFEALKARKIMIRHFNSLPDWNRITIGTPEQMQKFLNALKEIINHEK